MAPRQYTENGVQKHVTFSHCFSSTQPKHTLTLVPKFHLHNEASSASGNIVSPPLAFRGLDIFHDDLDSIAPSIDDNDRIKLVPALDMSKQFSDDPGIRPCSVEAYFRANQDTMTAIAKWCHEGHRDVSQEALTPSRSMRKEGGAPPQQEKNSNQEKDSKYAQQTSFLNDFEDFQHKMYTDYQDRMTNLREHMKEQIADKSLTERQDLLVRAIVSSLDISDARIQWYTQTTLDSLESARSKFDPSRAVRGKSHANCLLERMSHQRMLHRIRTGELKKDPVTFNMSWDELMSQTSKVLESSKISHEPSLNTKYPGADWQPSQDTSQTKPKKTAGVSVSVLGVGSIEIAGRDQSHTTSSGVIKLKPNYPLFTFVQKTKDNPELKLTTPLYPIFRALSAKGDPAEVCKMGWIEEWGDETEVCKLNEVDIHLAVGQEPSPALHFAAAVSQATERIQQWARAARESTGTEHGDTEQSTVKRTLDLSLQTDKDIWDAQSTHAEQVIDALKLFCIENAEAYETAALTARAKAIDRVNSLCMRYSYALSPDETSEMNAMVLSLDLAATQVALKLKQEALSLVTEQNRATHGSFWDAKQKRVEWHDQWAKHLAEQLAATRQKIGIDSSRKWHFEEWMQMLEASLRSRRVQKLSALQTRRENDLLSLLASPPETATGTSKIKTKKKKKVLRKRQKEPKESDSRDNLEAVLTYPASPEMTHQNTEMVPRRLHHPSKGLHFDTQQEDDLRLSVCSRHPSMLPASEGERLTGWTTIPKKPTKARQRRISNQSSSGGRHSTHKNTYSQILAADKRRDLNNKGSMAESQSRPQSLGKFGIGTGPPVNLGNYPKAVDIDERGKETIKALRSEKDRWDHDPTLKARAAFNELISSAEEQDSGAEEEEE